MRAAAALGQVDRTHQVATKLLSCLRRGRATREKEAKHEKKHPQPRPPSIPPLCDPEDDRPILCRRAKPRNSFVSFDAFTPIIPKSDDPSGLTVSVEDGVSFVPMYVQKPRRVSKNSKKNVPKSETVASGVEELIRQGSEELPKCRKENAGLSMPSAPPPPAPTPAPTPIPPEEMMQSDLLQTSLNSVQSSEENQVQGRRRSSIVSCFRVEVSKKGDKPVGKSRSESIRSASIMSSENERKRSSGLSSLSISREEEEDEEVCAQGLYANVDIELTECSPRHRTRFIQGGVDPIPTSTFTACPVVAPPQDFAVQDSPNDDPPETTFDIEITRTPGNGWVSEEEGEEEEEETDVTLSPHPPKQALKTEAKVMETYLKKVTEALGEGRHASSGGFFSAKDVGGVKEERRGVGGGLHPYKGRGMGGVAVEERTEEAQRMLGIVFAGARKLVRMQQASDAAKEEIRNQFVMCNEWGAVGTMFAHTRDPVRPHRSDAHKLERFAIAIRLPRRVLCVLHAWLQRTLKAVASRRRILSRLRHNLCFKAFRIWWSSQQCVLFERQHLVGRVFYRLQIAVRVKIYKSKPALRDFSEHEHITTLLKEPRVCHITTTTIAVHQGNIKNHTVFCGLFFEGKNLINTHNIHVCFTPFFFDAFSLTGFD